MTEHRAAHDKSVSAQLAPSHIVDVLERSLLGSGGCCCHGSFTAVRALSIRSLGFSWQVREVRVLRPESSS